MKITRKGDFKKGEDVEYIADLSEDEKIEYNDRWNIASDVYSIKGHQLFENDKKVVIVVEFPDTRAIFELKLFDDVEKDPSIGDVTEESPKLVGKDEEISLRRLGCHLYGHTFINCC